MSQLNAQFVKRGFWVDTARGPVMGQTLTTDTGTGNLVVALLAVLTTLGTSHLWNLVVFGYHQMRTHSRTTDGLLRQQQALLRTLPAPGAMLTDWLKLWWVWRKRADRATVRSLPLTTLAIIFTAVTVVVGVFSSYLVDSTNITVLVSSPYCGAIDWFGDDAMTDTASADWATWINSYRDTVAAMADSYTKDCYANRTAIPSRCRIFTRPILPFEQERTPCPFESSACKNISQPGLTIDSGLLDLNEHFGLNLAAKDGMKIRRKTNCAVVELEDLSDVKVASNMSETDWHILGRKLYTEEKFMTINLGSTAAANYTFAIGFMPKEPYRFVQTSPSFYYSTPFWNDYGGSFDPITQLQSNDSDLVVVIVAMHGTRFLEPVDDLLYSAHQAVNQTMSNNATRTSYMADSPASIFGCKSQYQYCFAQDGADDKCTTLGPLPSTQSASDFPDANDSQMALLRLLVQFSYWNDAQSGADHLTPSSIVSTFNAALPSDQWVHDFVTLENNIQTQMQIALTTHAVGFSILDLGVEPPMRANQTEAEKGLCGLQRMQSPGGFVNINVFALAFVITFCVLVSVLDLILLKFLVFWSKFRGFLAPRIDAWIQDGTFQLQRRAYEAYGEVTWERLDKEVPATAHDVELPALSFNSRPRCGCGGSRSRTWGSEGNTLSASTTKMSHVEVDEKFEHDVIDRQR